MEIELAMRTETDMDTNSFPPSNVMPSAGCEISAFNLGACRSVRLGAVGARARAADDAF